VQEGVEIQDRIEDGTHLGALLANENDLKPYLFLIFTTLD
jgi:hypothetical protein